MWTPKDSLHVLEIDFMDVPVDLTFAFIPFELGESRFLDQDKGGGGAYPSFNFRIYVCNYELASSLFVLIVNSGNEANESDAFTGTGLALQRPLPE